MLTGRSPPGQANASNKTRKRNMKTTLICSGGLDSITLAYETADEHTLTSLISFDYGQRHNKELHFAAICASDLNVPHHIIDISSFGKFLTGSALTDDIDVPDGHYAQDSMKSTVVSNRNAIMLTMAYGIATSAGDEAVGAAFHGGDHFIYPDCRPEFSAAFEIMQKHALEGLADIKLYTPFINSSKADIAAEAGRLNVPIANTWSCYKGGDTHCGRCGTCVERIEAFHLAGVTDPTQYIDTDYWRTQIKGAA